jgi:hypothetical protein
MTQIYVLAIAAALMAPHAFGNTIRLNFYVDDYGTVAIDGTPMGSYNNPAAAGNIDFTVDLAPGWHDIAIDYANRVGTNSLGLTYQLPGDPGLTLFPLDHLRSLDQSANFINGLRADYYNSLGGAFLFTVYGEGPIHHGALSFTDEIYEDAPGLWAHVFGPSADFEERLTGQILIGSVPEPATVLLAGLAIIGFLLRKRRAPTAVRA